ncbi:hypothetical protein FD754_006674, partial [Muntiacus muntjak]
MSTLANPPSILEMPQEIKKSCGDKQVEITVERIKMAKSLKEKQSNDLEKVAFKRKAEGEEKPAGKKEAKIIELDSLLITMPLPHIPLKNVMDVEVKLVYIDEENVSYEFVECDPSTGNQPTCRAAEIVDPLREPNFSVLPQIDKWLQVALKDASSCYRQKKYAMAAGQFRTALEKLLTVERKLSVDSRKNHGNSPVSDYYMGGGGGRGQCESNNSHLWSSFYVSGFVRNTELCQLSEPLKTLSSRIVRTKDQSQDAFTQDCLLENMMSSKSVFNIPGLPVHHQLLEFTQTHVHRVGDAIQ